MQSVFCDGEVFGIDLDSGEAADLLGFGGECRGADAEERVEHSGMFGLAVDFDALLGEGDGESGGMWALAFSGLDGFVGDEPCVAAAAEVLAAGVAPACDIGLIYVGHAGGAAIKGGVSSFGQVEDVFVAVVDVAFRIDRLEVAAGDLLVVLGFDRDRFDPVEGVLEDKKRVGSFGEC